MATMDLSGKTIATVEWNEYHGEIQRVRFTDGTTLLIDDQEYGHTVRLLNDRALAQLDRRGEIHEARFARRLAEQKRAREIQDARIARAKALLPKRVFDRWRRRVYPTMPEIIKDVWSAPEVLAQMNAPSPLFERFAS